MRLVAVGLACNNACVFCAQGELGSQPRAFDVEGALRAITPGETVAFVGGEPTLSESLPAWIRLADERGAARVVVQTNGRRLAYRAYTKSLREASSKLALDVSLSGSSAPMHDYHTGTPGSFEQTVLGLRNARAERIPAGLTTVVTRSNFRHLAELVRLAHALGAVAIHFPLAEALGRAARDRDRVVPARELATPHLVRAATEAKKLGLRVLADATGSDLFAGIGEVEPAEATASQAPPPEPKRVTLKVLGKPAPARGEARGAPKRTGQDLAAIFPDLFTMGPQAAPNPGPAEQAHVTTEPQAASTPTLRLAGDD